LCAVLVLAGQACEREARPFQQPRGPSGGASEAHRTRAASSIPADSPYRRNAWGISEGKRLYSFYNCVGCHAHGGGGMGPPLMDRRWIYGAQGPQVYESIARGRPNGMPAFGGRIPESQLWMLVAYVQSVSGNAPADVLPGRSDQMSAGPPENARPAQVPASRGVRQ
jgi:cytochrome c oxidase cbb3-type subunit 3